MGDILDKLEGLFRYITLHLEEGTTEEVDLEDVATWLEAAMDTIRQGREDMDRVVNRAASLQDMVKDLRREVGQLQGDQVDAAGELAIPLPEPGTNTAKLLSANVQLRRERDGLQAELATHRAISTQAVAVLHQLHVQEGLDLDGEVTLLMARVRVASGGGCGTCPLRRTLAVAFQARKGDSPVRSSCGHPEMAVHDHLEADVTRSQQDAGPAPVWCPLRGQPEDPAAEPPDDRTEDTDPGHTPSGIPWGGGMG